MRYNKYKAKKTVIDNIVFDSKKEAKRYLELKLLLKAGEIKDLTLQPVFVLLEEFIYMNDKIRPIKYIADFKYIDKKGNVVVEDVKGMKTDVYNLKKKLFLNRYKDLIFREI